MDFAKNRSLQTGSSETLIGWKSGQTPYVPLWDRMEGACLWTLGDFQPILRLSQASQAASTCVELKPTPHYVGKNP
jgi:hypothetical protein